MVADALTTVVSTKGQVILPKAIRDELRWLAGTRLVVEHSQGGVMLRPAAAPFPPTRAEEVFGSLPHAGRAKSIEEMQAGIDAALTIRHARGR